MSDENKRILSNQYRQLPRIESPDHLDQKILQEARKCTADNKIKRSYGWTPALAAACLVGVAFYIATPNYDVDSYRAPEPNVAVSFEAIEERSQAADLVAESEVMTPNSAAPASSSPSAHSSPQIGGSAAASKPMEPMRELNQSQAKRQMGVKSENRLGGIADTARSVTQSADQFQPESAQQRSRLLSDSETTISRLTAEDIQRRLEEITALADRALLEEAQKLLDDLLEECPECTVPEALAKLKDAEFQNDSAAGFKYDQIKQ